jgi:hypothetical protein
MNKERFFAANGMALITHGLVSTNALIFIILVATT